MNRYTIRLLLAGMLILMLGGKEQLEAQEDVLPSAFPGATSALLVTGDGYVRMGHDPALNPTTAFTIEVWVRRNNDSRCETIVSKGDETGYWLGICSETIRFIGSGSPRDGNTAIPANVWTHIAVVYKGSGREYYINGELDFQGGPEPMPTTNSLPVSIGADSATPARFLFDGRISNVRLWNVARSQEQIRRWMHVAIDEPIPGLVANWRLAGDYEDNVGGFHGAPQGTTSFSTTFPPPAQPPKVQLDRACLCAGIATLWPTCLRPTRRY